MLTENGNVGVVNRPGLLRAALIFAAFLGAWLVVPANASAATGVTVDSTMGFVEAAATSPPDADSETISDFELFTNFDETATASASGTEGTASATGDASGTLSGGFDELTGVSASGGGEASFTDLNPDQNHVNINVQGDGQFGVDFDVPEPGVTYTLSGSVSASSSDASSPCTRAMVSLDSTEFEFDAGNGCGGSGTLPVTASGTLDPGEHSIDAVAAAFQGTKLGSSGENADADWSFTLTLGQAATDSDGDGLLNDWETNGVDVDGDGAADLDLPSMGADPEHKDIFVEVDHMPGHRIPDAQINRVTQAFADAPVANPDGQSGIALHVDNGAGSVMNPRTGATWGAFSDQEEVPHQNVLGTEFDDDEYDWSQFESLRQTRFAAARRPAFHYAIAAHSGPDNDFAGIAQDIPGGDFLVMTHETCLPSQPVAVECTPDSDSQAATFMHELGHTLGLRHGGGDNLNRKPNYLSVMNYNFGFGLRQFTGVGNQTEFALDYSQFAIPLDERSLDEQHAFPISSGAATAYQTLYRCPSGARRAIPVLDTPVDWSCNGQIATFLITTDITNDTERTDLPGAIDWDRLVFDGGAVGDLAEPPTPDTTSIDEPTPEELIAAQEALEAGPVDDSGLPREPAPGGASLPPSGDPPPSDGAPPPAGSPETLPARLSVEFVDAKVKARTGKRVSFEYVANIPADVELEIRKRSKTVATVDGEADDGRNAISWNGRVERRGKRRAARPGTYVAVLTARSSDGQEASAETKLKVLRDR